MAGLLFAYRMTKSHMGSIANSSSWVRLPTQPTDPGRAKSHTALWERQTRSWNKTLAANEKPNIYTAVSGLEEEIVPPETICPLPR